VKNKFIAKNPGDFCDSATLNWETLITAMAFAYNTTVHRTIKATTFMLTYGVEHRTPVFSTNSSYFNVIDTKKFKLVHQLAKNHTQKATVEYSKEHNKKSIAPVYKEGELVLMKIFDLKNKNSKLAEK
jgi:hypothetical protein